MKSTYLLLLFVLLACTETPTSTGQPTYEPPAYNAELLYKMEQPGLNAFKLAFYVHPDTIKRHGAANILTQLVAKECETACLMDLWDDKSQFERNESVPYSKRSDKWQKQHFVAIADHLVAAKPSASSDEIINYPLTYDARYKRYGGKRRH